MATESAPPPQGSTEQGGRVARLLQVRPHRGQGRGTGAQAGGEERRLIKHNNILANLRGFQICV